MRLGLIALVLFVVAPSVGCRHAPPTLSPEATTAFQNTQIQQPLDLLRDLAVNAHAQTPPLLSEAATRKIVTYHQAAITTLHTRAQGWQATLLTGLTDLTATLAPAEQQLLAPYLTLVRTVLQGVQ